MLDSIVIQPVSHPIVGSISPPGSKSLTNRALVCAALAEGRSTLTGALDSDDTRVMVESLASLGIDVETCSAGETLVVSGTGGRFNVDRAELFVGNSGTTIRFLTAMVALGNGKFTLDGVPRMRERPIGDLLEALNQFGTKATALNGNGCPPVTVEGTGLAGGRVVVASAISSQYLSGLLMAAPLARGPVELVIDGPLVSKTYVEMTLAVMREFGIACEANQSLTSFRLPGGEVYRPCDYSIEPDASAASYFWAAAAITGGRVTVPGLSAASLQGDVAFVGCLEKMGCQIERGTDSISVVGPKKLHGIDVDMNTISDTAQTLAAVALFADGATTIRGIGHNRFKETDRIGNLAVELRKLGAVIEERDDGFTVHPGPLKSARIETYEDHRMAMSLALAGLRIPDVEIVGPGCSAKTYPNYWTDLKRFARY